MHPFLQRMIIIIIIIKAICNAQDPLKKAPNAIDKLSSVAFIAVQTNTSGLPAKVCRETDAEQMYKCNIYA